MERVKNGKLDMNRNMYKDIKKYDREQMNDFLQDIYETGLKNGYEKGLQEASKGLSEEEVKGFLTTVEDEIKVIKGIGIVKMKEIGTILERHLKELVKDEPE